MIERAAQLAVEAAFSVDSRVLEVEVTVRKPHALPGVVAGVSIHRVR
jgi:dihydroneopterin aldolase